MTGCGHEAAERSRSGAGNETTRRHVTSHGQAERERGAQSGTKAFAGALTELSPDLLIPGLASRHKRRL